MVMPAIASPFPPAAQNFLREPADVLENLKLPRFEFRASDRFARTFQSQDARFDRFEPFLVGAIPRPQITDRRRRRNDETRDRGAGFDPLPHKREYLARLPALPPVISTCAIGARTGAGATGAIRGATGKT